MNLHKVIEKWKKKLKSWLRWFRSSGWNIHISAFLDMCQGTWLFVTRVHDSWLSSEADLSDCCHKSLLQFSVVTWADTGLKFVFHLSESLGRIQNRNRIWTLLFSSPHIPRTPKNSLMDWFTFLPTDTIQMSCRIAQCLLIWEEM